MTATTPNPSTSRIPITSLATGLSHAGLWTDDLDRACRFYAEVFDATIQAVPAPPGTRSSMVRISDACALALMEVLEPEDAPEGVVGRRGHIDHIAFDVASAAALEEVRRRLVERGASDGVVRDYGPMLSVPFTDPDGMDTEVCWLRDPSFEDAGHPTVLEGSLLDLVAESSR